MSEDPVFKAYDRLRVVGGRDGEQAVNGKLVLRRARLPLGRDIPPRQWLYGTQLIRGYVSVLVAPGGTGKSAYGIGVGLSVAAYRAFLGDHIFVPVNVAIINLDDPMDELERRVEAFIIAHGINRHSLEDTLFLEDCDGHGLTLAAPARDDNGFYVAHPDEAALTQLLRENNIGLVVCDPFAESHTLEENSNPQMIQAAAVWRRIARAANCAVLLIHHVRKGDISSIDAARGAKSLTDSARAGLLMTTMGADEAEQFGVSEDDRQAYVRLDDAKRNLAPAAKAKWYRLTSVDLGNGCEPYPNGDKVQAIVRWTPKDAMTQLSNGQLNEALDIIGEPPAGWLYAPHNRGRDNQRWAGQVLVDLGMSQGNAQQMVKAWLNSGLLYTESYRDEAQRKMRTGVRVDHSKRPTI